MASKKERPTNVGCYGTSEKRAFLNKENKQILEEFLSYCSSKNMSQESIIQYKNKIEIFFVWLLENKENKSFLEITKKDIMLWQSEMVNNGKSSSVIRQYRSALSSLSKYIEDVCDEYKDFKNIVNKIPAPKTEYTRKKTYLPGSDFVMLENELVKREEWQKLCYLSLTYDAASRKSECFQSLKQIDFEKNETTIVKGKGGKKFTQPFSNKTAIYIKKWLESRGEDDCDKLFVTKTKEGTIKPISKNTLNSWCKHFSEIYKELTGKDEWIYPHSFKTNRLSNLYHEDNMPLEIVQDYGHHNEPTTTLNSYIEKKTSKTNAIVFKKQNETNEEE